MNIKTPLRQSAGFYIYPPRSWRNQFRARIEPHSATEKYVCHKHPSESVLNIMRSSTIRLRHKATGNFPWQSKSLSAVLRISNVQRPRFQHTAGIYREFSRPGSCEACTNGGGRCRVVLRDLYRGRHDLHYLVGLRCGLCCGHTFYRSYFCCFLGVVDFLDRA